MTLRELPPEEWSRLDATYLAPLWRLLTPETSTVLVVEQDGQIIGTWTIFSAVHVEGFSSPNGAVSRMLLRGMRDLAASRGITRVITASETDDMESYLHRLDPTVQAIPGKHFAWTLPTL